MLQEIAVKDAVHFQPISYFGRYRFQGRLTLPDLIRAIEVQSEGCFKAVHFKPPGCKNAHCSFHGSFLVMPGGRVMPLQRRAEEKCCSADADGPPGSICPLPIPAAEGATRAMAYVRRQLAAAYMPAAYMPAPTECVKKVKGSEPLEKRVDDNTAGQGELPSLDDFIARARTHTLSVSAMAFHDAWNVDLDRVRDCCIHVMAPDHRLIPFCLYNLTATDGRSLYRQ